ncbi:MAG: hypothetical protein QOE45_1341 [Frankiaceae bacterium]|jgi:hypothetical protein|nr:hypothetical protein [Frankiaceae bacterium]
MLKRFVIFLLILAGLLCLADRALATVAGNATAAEIKRHESLREDPSVRFRGFPFVTQALRGRFAAVDVTVRDLERDGVVISRIDAHLENVRVHLNEALKGRVRAVPVGKGEATVTVRYADLSSFLATRPGNIRIQSAGGKVTVSSTFGVPGFGQVVVEGTPQVKVAGSGVRVTVTDIRANGATRLSAAQAAAAGVRSSFTIPLGKLPFGIKAASARLTADALVLTATAEGFVIDVTG